MGDGSLPGVRADPDWNGVGSSVNAINDMMRAVLATAIKGQFADRPDLLEHVVPRYAPGAKRLLRDNGVWPAALKRETTSLITTPIGITPAGIVTDDGVEHEVDVIVYGTGFQASKFLTPMRATGRDGVDLHEHWGGDACAYLGVAVPGFPNLFCLYGPNTNIVINGSIACASPSAGCGLGCLELLLCEGAGALDVRRSARRVQRACRAENRRMAWGWSDVSSWYKNEHGRATQNWPFTLLEYWQRTVRPDPSDYELLA